MFLFMLLALEQTISYINVAYDIVVTKGLMKQIFEFLIFHESFWLYVRILSFEVKNRFREMTK